MERSPAAMPRQRLGVRSFRPSTSANRLSWQSNSRRLCNLGESDRKRNSDLPPNSIWVVWNRKNVETINRNVPGFRLCDPSRTLSGQARTQLAMARPNRLLPLARGIERPALNQLESIASSHHYPRTRSSSPSSRRRIQVVRELTNRTTSECYDQNVRKNLLVSMAFCVAALLISGCSSNSSSGSAKKLQTPSVSTKCDYAMQIVVASPEQRLAILRKLGSSSTEVDLPDYKYLTTSRQFCTGSEWVSWATWYYNKYGKFAGFESGRIKAEDPEGSLAKYLVEFCTTLKSTDMACTEEYKHP